MVRARGRATRGFPALALVKGANEVTIAAQLGGIIREMGPRAGQRVALGLPLLIGGLMVYRGWRQRRHT